MTNVNVKEWIGKGIRNLVPNSPNKNVINILRSLIEDENNICYIPLSYSAEKKTTTDSKIHFNPIEAGKTIMVTDIQSNKERFNFSVTGEVDVYVEFENEDGSVRLEPKKIFRTYTIIRDGKLTIDYIVAKLSEDTFNDLRNAGILYYNGVPVPENHAYIADFLYKVVLTDMPILSLAWAQPDNVGLYEYLDYENKLSTTMTEVNKIIKEFKEAGQTLPAFPEDSIYYNEPYLGETRTTDKILCECVVYSVADEKEVIQEYIDKCTNLIEATKVKKEINKILKNVRFISRCVTYAIELSEKKGSYNWSELEKIPRTKDKYAQTCQVPGLGRMYELKRMVYKKEF